MIDAKELRIGNLVRVKDKRNDYFKEIYVVTTIDGPSGVYNLKDSSGFLKHNYPGAFIEPIPLTEDILLKAGFEKASDYWGGLLISIGTAGSKIRIRNSEDGWYFSFNSESLYISTKYLHQLQNLFFAITGTELEIDL